MQSVSATPEAEIRSLGARRERARASGIPRALSRLHRATETLRWRQHHLIISRPSQHFSAEVSTEVHLMVHSRFGEICSCCCLPALPGTAVVFLNYVLRTILCTSVHFEFKERGRYKMGDGKLCLYAIVSMGSCFIVLTPPLPFRIAALWRTRCLWRLRLSFTPYSATSREFPFSRSAPLALSFCTWHFRLTSGGGKSGEELKELADLEQDREGCVVPARLTRKSSEVLCMARLKDGPQVA